MSSGRLLCLLLTAYCLLLTAYYSDFLGRVTRGPRLALSTFYDAHRAYRSFLVSRDGRQVLFLNGAQRSFIEFRIWFVPIEARKILLSPLVFENLAVARINFVAHLPHVFYEQTVKQRARDRLCAELIVQLVFVSDDRLDVRLVRAC